MPLLLLFFLNSVRQSKWKCIKVKDLCGARNF